MQKNYKERRTYFYACKGGCGRAARSFKRRRARKGLCKYCRAVNPNQMTIPAVLRELQNESL